MSHEVWTPTEGEVVADRFRLVRELGRGGMGSVWVADHVGLQVPCALKFIHEDAEVTDEHRSRFKQEAHAAARLKSRYVVQMLDHGVWKGAPYIAMELLEGELLSERLERVHKLTPEETLKIVRGVARALASATELGIVHRDLKPENIFLVAEAGEEYAKVLDFGVSKLTQPHLDGSHRTKTGALIGTPWYMSPEQIDGTMSVDHRSDLWSLSIITFQCITGEQPFQSTALGNLMLKIVNGPRPIPSQVNPQLPTAFDRWWQRCAERDADARFQSADEWLEALVKSFDESAVVTKSEPPVTQSEEEPAKSRQTFAGQARPSSAVGKSASIWLTALLAVATVGIATFLFWPRDDEPSISDPAARPPPETSSEAVPTAVPQPLPEGLPVGGVEPWQTVPSASASAAPSVAPVESVAPEAPEPPPPAGSTVPP